MKKKQCGSVFFAFYFALNMSISLFHNLHFTLCSFVFILYGVKDKEHVTGLDKLIYFHVCDIDIDRLLLTVTAGSER